MYLLFETNIDKLRSGGFVSNLTTGYLNNRLKGPQNRIEVASATYYVSDNFLEVAFDVQPTQGVNHYTVILRFYDVGKYVKDDLGKARFSVVEHTLNKIIKQCDVRFYSDDPSFLWQGCWEGLDKNDMSIFKFTQPKGDGIWDNRHMLSGGIGNRELHLTKHIAQIVTYIDGYIHTIAQKINVKY